MPKLIALTYWRIAVRERSVPGPVEYLRAYLRTRGCLKESELSDNDLLPFIHEALRRAAEREKDWVPRWGPTYEEIETIGAAIDAVYDDKPGADSRVRAMLEFNSLV